jgi:ATP-dependent DNA ligase
VLLLIQTTNGWPEIVRASVAALASQLLSLKKQILDFDRMHGLAPLQPNEQASQLHSRCWPVAGAGVRLITRNGNDFTARFPLVVSAVAALPARSCLIDGEGIVCDENGLAVFELIRGGGSKTSAVLCAFDLLELDGRDLRRRPIEERKGLLAKLLHDPNLSLDTAMKKSGIVLNQHFEEDGAIVFGEACRLGC